MITTTTTGTPDKRVKQHQQQGEGGEAEIEQEEETSHHLHEAHRIDETGDGTYKPSEHNGVKKDGTHFDGRLSEPTVQLYREEEVEGEQQHQH